MQNKKIVTIINGCNACTWFKESVDTHKENKNPIDKTNAHDEYIISHTINARNPSTRL